MKKLFYIITVVSVVLAFYSCKDDDSFSTSPQHQLTIIDSLSFDTVFSRIPTSAKSFWIYNNSGDGIRCRNIRLKKGNQSGFRVNVDGENLGADKGYQISDLEIRKGDSIRVFVELTAKPNYADGPQFKEEELLFQLESGVIQKVNLNAWTWDVDTVHNMRITNQYVIQNLQRPLIVFNGIQVDSTAELTIKEGTTIYFHDNAGISVYGSLKCEGTADANVVLRSYRLDNMFDYLPYDCTPGHWQGITFMPSSFDNKISYTDIHGSYNGIVCDSSDVSKEKLILENSTVHNCKGYGLYSYHSNVQLGNCQITNTLNNCVCVVGGKLSMAHCTLGQFYGFDANRGAALYFTNEIDTVKAPLLALDVVNSIVTGYASDVLSGVPSKDTAVAFNYAFSYSLIRTPEVDDSLKFSHVIFETPEDSINGAKHFKNIDIDLLRYDFHLDSITPCRGAADPKRLLPLNRDGLRREDVGNNLGCY